MLISVVIPALNEEKYIGRCLASLRAQTHPRELYEIIVVDNASTDRTSEIARGLGAQVVHEPRRGVGWARHRGAREARGEIIGSNFAVRTSDYWKVGGFNTSLFSAEDIDLGIRLTTVSRTMFDPKMVMYVSARRTREGYLSVLRRTSQACVRVVFLGMPPAGEDFAPIR
jgi:glycosyltransferase involved in cell wall biosynthesis